MEKLRIVLADDHRNMRERARKLIETQNDLEVVGEVDDGAAIFETICELRPDVAIIDIRLPRLNRIELVSRINSENRKTRLLVWTSNDDLGAMRQLLKSGVAGYLLKKSADDELIIAIRTVGIGGRYLDPSVIDDLVEEMPVSNKTANVPSSSQAGLSEREEEVLRWIAQGFANKEIAAKLSISMKTVETYKSRSMAKLGLHGRADIVRYAVGQDWLRDAPS